MHAQFLASVSITSLRGGHILGSIGSFGGFLIALVVLVLGVRGRGRHSFSHEQAGVVGYLVGNFAIGAGVLLFQQVTVSLMTSVNGVGPAVAATLLAAWFWLGKPKPPKAALIGIAAGSIGALAGGIWALPPALISTGLAHIGA